MAEFQARREVDTDGVIVPAWLMGDGEHPERLQVSVVWAPFIYVNGHLVPAYSLELEEPPSDLAITATLESRAVRRDRAGEYDRELAELAVALPDVGTAWAAYNFSLLRVLLRAALAGRGFPVP